MVKKGDELAKVSERVEVFQKKPVERVDDGVVDREV